MLRTLTLIIILLVTDLYSQSFELNNWKALLSHKSFRDFTLDTNYNLWFASSGGIVKHSYDDYLKRKNNLAIFDNVSGLSSVDYSAIDCITQYNIIIAGTNQGNIDLIFEDGRILNVNDIANSNITSKKINDIEYLDGKVYIGGAFGLTEFIPNPNGNTFEQIFGDSYRATSVNKIKRFGDKLYIATEQNGIQYIQLGENISDPKNWTSITTQNGLPANNIKDFAFQNDSLYVAIDKQVYKGKDTFELFKSYDYLINNFLTYNGKLYVDNQFITSEIEGSDAFMYFGNDTIIDSYHHQAVGLRDYLLLLTEHEGAIMVIENKIDRRINPNTSFSNSVYDMEIDSKNNLWLTTGTYGFMKFDGENWEYFNSYIKNSKGQNIPQNAYKKIAINRNDDVYLGFRGATGQLVIRNSNTNPDYEIYNELNSGFVGIDPTNAPSFFEAAETQFDRNNVAWTVNWADFYPGPALIAEDNGKFYSFVTCAGITKRKYYNLVIDNNGTKWLGGTDDGIVLYNENNTLEDKSDDICMNFTTSQVRDLANNQVTSLAFDKNGWVWAGTPTGISYFLNPNAILYDDDPNSLVAVKPSIFQDFAVNQIYVDAINNKWIASANGLYVYNADATKLLLHLTSDNSPLPTNDVKNITINDKTGEVYIATALGLYKANSISIKPQKEYDIICYPQPYVSNSGNYLTIEGLAAKSDIRITSSNGLLVRRISAEGNKIYWDGKDESGNFVKSGVYLILASSGTENLQSVHKIAIINNK